MFYNTPEEWEDGITVNEFSTRLLSRKEAALLIEQITMGRTSDHRKKSSKSGKRNGVDL